MARTKRPKAAGEMRRAILRARKMVQTLAEQDGNEAETRRRVERIFDKVMGYDVFTHLTREHAIRGSGETEHVDFAVQLGDGERARPTIMVELKRVNVKLAPKHLRQASSYAINTGCEWILLTNARAWRLYHVAYGQPPVTKLLSSWDLLEDDVDELAEHFTLISYRSVKKGALDDLWQKRKVLHPRNLLQAILSDESIKILRRALRKTTGVLLSPEDVIAGVRRLLNEGALSELEDIRISLPEGRRRRRKSSGETPKRRDIRVSLSQVIEAGILAAPLPLFRKYKGNELHATLQPDGAVEFQGTRYDNSSKAAEAARQTITGKKMNTNGWTFWRYRTPSGDRRSLADARSDFAARRAKVTA